MIIYHGSKRIIEQPLAHGSNPHNDYGSAFYMTRDLESAKSWACKNDSLGIVNKYSIDDRSLANLKVLDLTDKNLFSVLNWLAILMHFRTLDTPFVRTNKLTLEWLKRYYIDINDYDVVIGFRADDSYFRFPIRFVSNDLSYEDLEGVFLSGDLGVQYAFVSERAVSCLRFVEAFDCEKEFLGHHHSLVADATRKFDEIISRPRDPKKHYILDLMRDSDE
jgi:hypothetical protein